MKKLPKREVIAGMVGKLKRMGYLIEKLIKLTEGTKVALPTMDPQERVKAEAEVVESEKQIEIMTAVFNENADRVIKMQASMGLGK